MRGWGRHGKLASQMCKPDVPAKLEPICFRKASLWIAGGIPGFYSEGPLLCDPTLPYTFSRAMSIRKESAG